MRRNTHTKAEAAFQAWTDRVRCDASCWHVDETQNGRDRDDLLAYCPRPDDPTMGIYVTIEPDEDERGRPLPTYRIIAGRYSDADPDISDAAFRRSLIRTGLPSFTEARLHASYRLGMPFLLDLLALESA
jgi:hypothetical protein